MIVKIPFSEMNEYEFNEFKKEFDLTKWNEYRKNLENTIEILSMNNLRVEVNNDKTEKKGLLKRWL